ncbi:MAG: DinB family protein [Acidimicrobiia bacterium]|nr:DinB family protein [Acidimicrobiia bacterium]
MAKRTWPDGSSPSLRWILLPMIEEYARHNGRAARGEVGPTSPGAGVDNDAASTG